MKKSLKPVQGDFDPDLAEWLIMAQIYGSDVFDPSLTPYDLIVMFGQPGGEPLTGRDKVAGRLMAEISKQQINKKALRDMILKGWVFYFLATENRFPTVSKVASAMGISRAAYYRRYSIEALPRACNSALSVPEIPTPEGGMTLAQRANCRAKKSARKKSTG